MTEPEQAAAESSERSGETNPCCDPERRMDHEDPVCPVGDAVRHAAGRYHPLVITLSSQYYRMIGIPESLFGIMGSVVALLGVVVPKIARQIAENRSPRQRF